MTSEDRKAVVAYRIEKSDATYADVIKTMEFGMC